MAATPQVTGLETVDTSIPLKPDATAFTLPIAPSAEPTFDTNLETAGLDATHP